jgi:hypothetical protein
VRPPSREHRPSLVDVAAFASARAEQHAFPLDFPSPVIATQLAESFIADPWIFGVVRAIRSEGWGRSPLILPSKAARVGRQLMEVVLDRGQDAVGVWRAEWAELIETIRRAGL